VRILVDDAWRDGFLDYWRAPSEYRIAVVAWRVVEPVEDLYFVRPRSFRMVLNYVREIGPIASVRKIRSRLQERARNEKYVSCGLARIVEAPGGGTLQVGRAVAFAAPQHPACAERLALPAGLLAPVEDAALAGFASGEIRHLKAAAPVQTLPLRGWSPHAAVPLAADAIARTVAELTTLAVQTDWSAARRLPAAADPAPQERAAEKARPPRRERPSAVLFGYGNYAKTTILPNVAGALDVRAIHEIDPTQIPLERGPAAWDSAPVLREREDCDVCLVAGYHATHAPLAIEALRRGAAVVVEKPLAVDRAQLDALLDAMQVSGGRLYACFQRRYSPLTALARKDLSVARGEPISYHCIVYEVPLPAAHWYRWPSSGSRILSNGCHWIDHFLFLNDFGDVVAHDVFVARDGTVMCALELENGAAFSMALTSVGSERVGVQDHVELRAGDVTVRIADNSRYRADSTQRTLRSRTVNRTRSYRDMYRDIARRVAAGEPGDSIASVRSSAGAVLALERTHAGLRR
jgi:predicted dehydrogenase